MMMDAKPRVAAIIRSTARGAVAYVAGVSLLVLAGWMWDVELLRSFLHPDGVAMNPLTALTFILCAASLWLQRDEASRLRTRPAARALAGAAAAVALVVLAGMLLGWDAHLDEWMFRDRMLTRVGRNRMAPNTAINFLLVGLALLFLDAQTRSGMRPAQLLTLLAGCTGLLALTGYAFRFLSFYLVADGYVPMALNTALSFTVLCLGMLCARADHEPMRSLASNTVGGIMARRLLPAAYGVPLALGWLRLRGEQAGLYRPQTGLSLFALSNILAFNVLIWWNARLLYRVDEDRRRAEGALGESEERHRAVVEQTAEAIFLVDRATRRVTDCNPAFSRLLGYPTEEARALTLDDFVREPAGGNRADVASGRGDMPGNRRLGDVDADGAPGDGRAGRPASVECRYRRRDGSEVEVELSASVIGYGGRQVTCTVAHDITRRKLAERQLHEQNLRLERAAQAERQAMDALRAAQGHLVQNEKMAGLGQMVAGVAHEINNPLAFVSNNVAVLQRDVQPLTELLRLYQQADPALAAAEPQLMAQIAELAERIDLAYTLENVHDLLARSREGLRRIQQIVADLRDFARLDESDLHEVDLNDGVRSTVNIIGARAVKKGVRVVADLNPLPPVACYPAKINQVVMNLLANAIDASPDGGEVTVRTDANADADVSAGGGVRIEVTDRGGGMTPAVREKVFDPFFTTKPQGEGTGLGLSISYGIARDHGGRIDIDSSPGHGARFTLRLPLRPPGPPGA